MVSWWDGKSVFKFQDGYFKPRSFRIIGNINHKIVINRTCCSSYCYSQTLILLGYIGFIMHVLLREYIGTRMFTGINSTI